MVNVDVEAALYDYVERFRTLFAPETWQRLAMDLSKNDFLALLFLHRAGESRMSDLADYLRSPMNTATGVVARLQRRSLVERLNSPDDKRVVVVRLTPQGREQMTAALREGLSLANRILGDLSSEQLDLLLGTLDQVLRTLGETEQKQRAARPAVRRIPID